MGKVVKGIFGGSESAGVLGTGQFRAKEYNIKDEAFDPTKTASYGLGQQSRGLQSDFISQLQRQMQGEGPSLANLQLQQATNRNIAQTMGQAASQRGVNPALAARLAMNNIAGANQQAASDSVLIRQQEMMNAQQQLGSQIGAQRQGDLAEVDRDLSARMSRENLGVQQQTGLNNANQAGYEGAAKRRGDFISNLGGGVASMFSDENMKKNVDEPISKVKAFENSFREKTISEEAPKKSKSEQEAEDNSKKITGDKGLIGTMMRMIGPSQAQAASDKGNKTSDSPGNKEIQGFLDAIKAHTYEYKNEFKDAALGGEGKYVSPMAQEIEQTKLGKNMVIDTPDGKVVDYGKGFGAMLAAQAMLNERLKKLEGKRKV
jgi:hypothetical protein